jgi:hypothetical protein
VCVCVVYILVCIFRVECCELPNIRINIIIRTPLLLAARASAGNHGQLQGINSVTGGKINILGHSIGHSE